jgi:hypothetical protein
MPSLILDLAYNAPDSPLLDPLGESRWQQILELWLLNLQNELPQEFTADAYSVGLQLCSDEVIAACVRPGGAYGLIDARVGLPVRLGRRGLREVVKLPLRPHELQALQEAGERLAQRIGELSKLPSNSEPTTVAALVG